MRKLLKRERQARVGGRAALAQKAGVAASTIQNIETGPDVPGIETLAKLVEGMGMNLADFFSRLSAGIKLATPAAADQEAATTHEYGRTGGDPSLRLLDLTPPSPADAEQLRRLGLAFLSAAAHARESEEEARKVREAGEGAAKRRRPRTRRR